MYIINKTEQQSYYDKWIERYTKAFQRISPDRYEECFFTRVNDILPSVPYEDYHLVGISQDIIQLKALIDTYKQVKELSGNDH